MIQIMEYERKGLWCAIVFVFFWILKFIYFREKIDSIAVSNSNSIDVFVVQSKQCVGIHLSMFDVRYIYIIKTLIIAYGESLLVMFRGWNVWRSKNSCANPVLIMWWLDNVTTIGVILRKSWKDLIMSTLHTTLLVQLDIMLGKAVIGIVFNTLSCITLFSYMIQNYLGL